MLYNDVFSARRSAWIASMLLDLSEIQGARERVDRTIEPAALDCREEDYVLGAPVSLALEVLRTREKFQLVGHLRTTLELACSRCLESFSWPVDAGFDLVYLPASENTGEGENEVQDDELATAFYRDNQIDLGQLMREQFYLSLPMKPLCGETCRGLCPECGTNLNREMCACERRWDDPRFAGLRSLLNDQ